MRRGSLLVTVLLCAGCAEASTPAASTSPPSPVSAAPAGPPGARTSGAGHRHPAAHRPSHRRHITHARHRGRARLAYSTASSDIVQEQPPPGSCHAIGSGVYERPDPSCTPGALNPAVTQATIHSTICVAGWTDTVRPPEAITEQEKMASLASYGDAGSLSEYEYDHFVPLELGGATNDPRNLWPEPGPSPNAKDALEDALRLQVCDGQISLARGQQEIVINWTALVRRSASAPPAPTSRGGAPSGRCTVSGAYNSRHGDYDVSVHSNQPDRSVTVTDGLGDSATWHTDASGYADVYLRANRAAAGARVTASVGSARCSGKL